MKYFFLCNKGKGLQKTYWLIGKTGYSKPLPQTMIR